MNTARHADSCLEAFGRSYAEVHEFLDQYSHRFPRAHRQVYHHRQGLSLVAERFGPEAVWATERHIIEDMGFIPAGHTFYATDNQELLDLVKSTYEPGR